MRDEAFPEQAEAQLPIVWRLEGDLIDFRKALQADQCEREVLLCGEVA